MEVCCGHHSGQKEGFELIEKLGTIIEDCEYVLNQLRVPLTKALNPLKRRDFVRLEAQLTVKLRAAFKKVGGDEIKKVTSLIRSINLAKPDTIEQFVKESAVALRGLERGVAREVVPILEHAIRDIYQMSKQERVKELLDSEKITGDKKKLSAFGVRDERVVDLINKHQVFYVNEGVKNQIKNFDERAKKILSNGLEGGWTRDEIAGRLTKSFGATVDDPDYWKVVSAAWMNRTRNWSSLEVMADGGIENYVIIEMMDERTCPICQEMNGKEFSVKKQVNMLESIAASEDPDDLRYRTPWLTTRLTEDRQVEIGYRREPGGRFWGIGIAGGNMKVEPTLQRLGVSMPPFHGLCRGTIGAV